MLFVAKSLSEHGNFDALGRTRMPFKTPDGRDRVVMAVLDEIFGSAQIDPEIIGPDYKLGRDLGIDHLTIQLILSRSAKSLGLEIPFECCRVEDSSARELVSTIKKWAANNNSAAA